jgi:hypothetical protein
MQSPTVKNAILNSALVVGSLVVFFLILEVAVLKGFATYLPLKVQRHFGDVSAIAQSSKTSVVPKDYILLVGDSFAAGSGDWLFTVDHNRNPDFNSAHVIHKALRRDVLNIGQPGVGSVDALVAAPVSKFETINASPFLSLAPPDDVWIYFYEGNDIENNTSDLFRDREVPEIDMLPQYLDETLFPEVMADARRRLDRLRAPAENTFHVFRAFLNMARHEVKLLLGTTSEPMITISGANTLGEDHTWLGRTGLNTIRLEEATAGAPALRGPGPQLDQGQIDLGVKVFEHSVRFLKSYFPETRLKIVYIPSAAAIYEFEASDVAISLHVAGRPVQRINLAAVRQRSDDICRAVAEVASALGATFVDTRPHLRGVAKTEIIHGPVDETHFNKRGYEELVAAILTPPPGTCSP